MNKAMTIGLSALAVGMALAPATAGQAAPTPEYKWTEFQPADLGDQAYIHSMKAVGPKNVWVFSSKSYADMGTDLVAQHWNGRRWTKVALPARISSVSETVGTASNLFAVALYTEGTHTESAVLHFDGKSWKIAKRFPNTGLALSGPAVLRDGSFQIVQPKKNGTAVWHRTRKGRWTKTTSSRVVYGVSSLPDGTAWASTGPLSTTLARFDGKKWTTVKGPSAAQLGCAKPKKCAFESEDVLALSPHNVVAAFFAGESGKMPSNYVARWDGKKWRVLSSVGDLAWEHFLRSDGKGGFWDVLVHRVTPDETVKHYTKSGRVISYPVADEQNGLYDLAVSPAGDVFGYRNANSHRPWTTTAWKLVLG